jgi:hypothetical protein
MNGTMDWFALVVVVLALAAAIYSISSTARMAREAMRRQADMEKLLVVTHLSGAADPAIRAQAPLVATMGQPQEPAQPQFTRIPMQPTYQQDADGYDLPNNLQT